LRSRIATSAFARESPEPNVEECQKLRAQLRQLAAAARTAGLLTYSSLSLRVAEELQPHVCCGSIPDTVAKLLLLWPKVSLRYLRGPEHINRAEELIKLLDAAMGSRRFGRIERELLIRGLTELLDQRQSEAFPRQVVPEL